MSSQTLTIKLPLDILKQAKKPRELIVVDPIEFEKTIERKLELKDALMAIKEGNRAVRQKKTRSFNDFIFKEHPQYAGYLIKKH